MQSSCASNPHLQELLVDELFHLGLSTKVDLKREFSDVKFVCLGGSRNRMKKVAEFVHTQLISQGLCNSLLTSLSQTDRYVMYKAGPVLSVNHGIGIPSASIILNELIKLLHYAEAKNVVFFRIGTSGGLGTEPGTVVITKQAVNGSLEPYFEQIVLGKKMRYASDLDKDLASQLLKYKTQDFSIILGDTMCTSDFYEGQGRLDGAFCDYEKDDKMRYLRDIHSHGVRNIEMESACFAAMCKRAGIKSAVVCVTLLDRLKGDQVTLCESDHEEFQMRPVKIIMSYILDVLTKQKM